jgi:serine/threonine-protein kinase
MGAVYEAWDTRLTGLLVAVKENFNTAPVAQTQFQVEAAILARLNHPALPRVTDYFIEASGRQYLVMDLIAGQNLEEIVQQRGRITESEVVRWATDALHALEYLHTQQPPIIHRDIKPPNIKLRPVGKFVLVDFGIAKVAHTPHQHTQTGARAGTPGYAPLEQYGRGMTTDARTDVYALAATMYFMLTGAPPPEATEIASGLQPLVPPSQRGITIRPAVEQAILRALAIDANQRFQTARAFRDALTAPAPAPVRTPSRPQALTHTATASPQIAAPSMPISAPPRAPSVPYTSTPSVTYASGWSRFGAYLIDTVIMWIVNIPLNLVTMVLSAASSGSGNSSDTGILVLSCVNALCSLSVNVSYYILLTAINGQTVGKKAVGIRVVATDGTRIGMGKSIVRYGFVKK